MNSIWNSNIALFSRRFPALANMYAPRIARWADAGEACIADFVKNSAGLEIAEARNGQKTLLQNGMPLHSLYNPQKEAANAAAQFAADRDAAFQDKHDAKTAAVFLGFGLGYLPVALSCVLHNERGFALVLVEAEIERVFLAFFFVDFAPLFALKNCSFIIGAPPTDVITVLDAVIHSACDAAGNSASETASDTAPVGALSVAHFFSFESNQAHAKAYFAAVTELIERNKQKERINTRTAQKFLVLWQKNNAKNRDVLQTCSGVKKFFGTDNRPALVIAAGPTLDDAIDFIQRAKTHKTHTLICVDTALRTLLRHGIEPDFILVADAQYWNYCHLNGLESKSSVLVAEVSAYPPVMRFACRETAVFDSAHPQKSKTDTQDWAAEKGTLGAGGTVASSAWDFARMLGATRIVLAGMDLSFPHKLTHARGSLFEERAHANANRMAPVETHSVSALFGAPSSYVQDNAGHIVLSDIRMDLYAWWFESQAEKYPNVKTVALSMHSRKIPGIAVGE